MAKQQTRKSPNTPPQYPKQKIEKKAVADASTTDWMQGRLPIYIVLGITFLAFAPTFQSEFVNWDDPNNIYENKYLRDFTWQNIVSIFTTDVIGGYNPLSIFSFALEKAIFGEENWSTVIHTNNLLLHLVCVFLAWRVAIEMGLSRFGALVVALLFGIHPMRVESVAWATERKDVLFGAFYFGAILNYIKYLKSENYTLTNRNFLLAFGLFVLSLFSKVQAVSLPLSLLAIDYYYKRPLSIKLIFEKIHFFLGSLGYGFLNIYFLTKAKTISDSSVALFSLPERFVIAMHSYFVYVVKFIFPYELNPLYAYPPTIPTHFYATSLLFVLSIAGVIWAHRKGWTTLVFGWVFFFVNFIFVSQIVGAGQGFLADRFTYIPYFGFWVILAAYFFKNTEGGDFNEKLKIKNPTWAKWAVYAYTALCFIMTFQQTEVWQNPEKLWSHSINANPEPTTPYLNRANNWRTKKEFAKALADYDKAISIKPEAAALNSRGKTHFDMGNATQALQDYTAATQKKESDKLAEVWANRASAYGSMGQLEAAMADLNKALSIDSLHVNALMTRGNVLGEMKNYEASIRDLTKARELEPFNTDVLSNRLFTYREMGKFDLALADADTYLTIKKENANVWADRAFLKKSLNRCAEALPDFDEAVRLGSNQIGVFVERAQCHRLLGNVAAMKADVQKALQLGAPPAQMPIELMQ
jgi:protein O-mannosyl-transferase